MVIIGLCDFYKYTGTTRSNMSAIKAIEETASQRVSENKLCWTLAVSSHDIWLNHRWKSTRINELLSCLCFEWGPGMLGHEHLNSMWRWGISTEQVAEILRCKFFIQMAAFILRFVSLRSEITWTYTYKIQSWDLGLRFQSFFWWSIVAENRRNALRYMTYSSFAG